METPASADTPAPHVPFEGETESTAASARKQVPSHRRKPDWTNPHSDFRKKADMSIMTMPPVG